MASADYQAIIRIIFGKRKSGKSHLGRKLARPQKRKLFYDTTGHDFDETDGFIIRTMPELQAFIKENYRKDFSIVYRSPDPLEDIETVSLLVMDIESMWFIIDEAHNYFKGYRPLPGLNKVVHEGRHSNIDLVLITQCPVDLGPMTRDQAEELYIFKTREPRIMDYFRDAIGSEEVAKLPELDKSKHEYLFFSDELEETEIRHESA